MIFVEVAVFFVEMLNDYFKGYVIFLWSGYVILFVERLHDFCLDMLHDFFCVERLRDLSYISTHSFRLHDFIVEVA